MKTYLSRRGEERRQRSDARRGKTGGGGRKEKRSLVYRWGKEIAGRRKREAGKNGGQKVKPEREREDVGHRGGEKEEVRGGGVERDVTEGGRRRDGEITW